MPGANGHVGRGHAEPGAFLRVAQEPCAREQEVGQDEGDRRTLGEDDAEARVEALFARCLLTLHAELPRHGRRLERDLAS